MAGNRFLTLEKGSELEGPTRTMTEDRLRWYGDAMLTASAGEPTSVGINIHTDDDFAREEGLPAAIADGMLGANWLAGILLDYFGVHYALRSYFRVKFIKPVMRQVVLHCRGVVTDIVRDDDGATYHMDLWIVDDSDTKLTVCEATVTVPTSELE